LFALSSIEAFSQSKLDVVRASNYYASSLTKYKSLQFNSAYSDLLLAEENLRGKSNYDLEFLRIMCLYKLEKYQEALTWVEKYFNEPPKGETFKGFENVESYYNSDKISYGEELTALFVELEEWAATERDANPEELISELSTRIAGNIFDVIKVYYDNPDFISIPSYNRPRSYWSDSWYGITESTTKNIAVKDFKFANFKYNDGTTQPGVQFKIIITAEQKQVIYHREKIHKKRSPGTYYYKQTAFAYFNAKIGIRPRGDRVEVITIPIVESVERVNITWDDGATNTSDIEDETEVFFYDIYLKFMDDLKEEMNEYKRLTEKETFIYERADKSDFESEVFSKLRGLMARLN